MRKSVVLPVLALSLSTLFLPACKGSKQSPPSSPSPGASGTPVAFQPEKLSPGIAEITVEGGPPEGLVIDFGTPVFDQAKVGQVSAKSVLKLEPEAPGSLTISGPATLQFTPFKPFKLATSYTATLEKVDTRQGLLIAPGNHWSHSFTTSAFELLRVDAEPADLQKKTVNADLVFSGEVDPATARPFLSVSVDGKGVRDFKLASETDKRRLKVMLASPSLRGGTEVAFALRKGVPTLDGKLKAAAAEKSFTVQTAAEMEVLTALLKEGGSGYHVSVVCNDHAVGGNRYWYDRSGGGYYYLSDRCWASEASAKEHIHFKPAVKFTLSPARYGFDVFGEFVRGHYDLTIDPGLSTQDGGVLEKPFTHSFDVSPRTPVLSFAATGRYLPRSAWKSLAVKHMNVEKAELTVRQIPPENLVYWLSDLSDEKATERTSNLLLGTTIPLKGEPDQESTSWIDVAGLLPATTKGVLELTLNGVGVAKPATARLLLTEMGLVAKASADWQKSHEAFVWAIGMESIGPVPGVDVSLVKMSGQAVARCTTDASGGCRLSGGSEGPEDSVPFALIARKGEDLTYIRWADLKDEIADSAVQGEPYEATQVYRAGAYTDRGVYRPGDTAHLVAILRGKDGLAPPAGLPVALEIVDPKERVTKKAALKTGPSGLVSYDLPFEAFADTGNWTAKVKVAETEVAAIPVQVEEFVPERMKVTATTAEKGYLRDATVGVDVSARYLFGGSAESSKVEMVCSLEPSEFHPKLNGGYRYGVWRSEEEGKAVKPVSLGQVEGTLDEKGSTHLECPVPGTAGGFDGPAKLVANVSVFEAGSGRSTFAQVMVPSHPAKFYVGLDSQTKQALAGKPLSVAGVVVDWEGKPVAPGAVAEVEVELSRLESEYGEYWDEDEGGGRYQRMLREVPEWKGTAVVSAGKFHLDLIPHEAAVGYLVRVKNGEAHADLQVPGAYDGYYWSMNEQKVDQTPKPAKPTALPVTAPKSMKVGEPVTVTIRAPYKGRVLFTAETDRVITSEWKTVPAGDSSWSFKLGTFAPNVYLSAFLVKDPHLESQASYLPDRAFGVASVMVEPVDFLQRIVLDVPAEVRSNSKLTVSFDLGRTEGPTVATVAAVDEGILSLTHFQTPDPLAQLFAKRALGVETYETVGWTLLVPPAGPSRSHGGDNGDDKKSAAGRVQPVKPVALWSGVVPVPDTGKASVTFEVPQYRGQLRVMVVSAGPKRIGRAETSVTVSDPIVVQTTLPRFLTEGDEAQIPVFVTNMSGKPLDVKVSLTSENLPVPGIETLGDDPSPLKLLGKPEGNAHLDNGKSATLVFQAKAVKVVGAAKLKVVAKGGEFESHDDLEVPFLPSGPRMREVQKLEVASAGTIQLEPKLKDWVPTSETTTFWVTGNPYGESFSHLRWLVQYPYG